MNRPEEDLLARYLEGETTPEEETALLELLRRDPRAAEKLESFLRLDEGLRQSLVPEASGDALVRAVAERLAKRGGTGVFARQVVEQIAAAESSGRKKTRWIRILRPRDRQSGSWTLPLIAAAALFAILIVAAVASQGQKRPSRPELRDSATVPVPEAPSTPGARPALNAVELKKAVAALEQERRALEAKRGQTLKEVEDARRGELLKQSEAELARIAAQYRERVEELKKAEQTVVKTPGPSSTIPAAAIPVPVARVERSEGEVFLTTKEGPVPMRAPQDLSAGWEIRVAAVSGSAVVVLADGTRLDLADRAQVREEQPVRGSRGLRLFVTQGTLNAGVKPQPAGQPLVFATPNAEAKVLGTRLRLDVNHTATVLEVTEGKVRLTRTLDGRSVDVGAGQNAEVNRGVALEVRSSHAFDEILLALPQGQIVSSKRRAPPDWKMAEDARAHKQAAFDAPKTRNGADPEARALLKNNLLGYVEYTFRADVDKEYTVWVRGCRGTKGDPQVAGNEWYRFDLLALEILDAQASSGQAYEFNGYGQRDGFWWISGNADPADVALAGQATDAPMRVKFQRRGLQVLRVYPIESPMRFDVVWLSATQKQRPPDDHPGLEAPKK